ncbi:phosphoesterase-domain-containing protein [Daldinia vernicosa]|uniref:phosphoesterase-domain-containing protein n=1 Tax=Daldinia vernicosa TaxID=114800 RepID=UPI0020085969|nr:phosphoesterase-domain-containing protein [Daldinia vernicosa]KAI0845936.1 phosphoesterase-domain-containing protein [Daldinia vernicosa]
MHPLVLSAAIFAANVAAQAENTYTATATSDVEKARATAKTLSPTSNVKGKAFDRLAIIWLENTDYDMAIGDPNLTWLAKRGITLSNYHAVTHPSQPNYIAAIGGDYFGMQHDDFTQVDKNVSTIIDLLEDKGISWSEYQEDMPYSGFEGFAYINQKNGKNDYVRKHNPAVSYNANARLVDRLAVIKNLTTFYQDLENETLPQWMFITPNMTSDGHDTDVTVAGTWSRTFLEPLLSDKRFMQNTLVVITFDENETYSIQNRILAILIGDAVPADLVGTTDDSYYNHYSEIATAEANWDLHTLGRFDVGANVFKFVAEKTGDTVRSWNGDVPLSDMYFNSSYAGPLNEEGGNKRYPAPNLVDASDLHNRTVLPSIKEAWEGNSAPVYYSSSLETPDGQHPPKGYAPSE